jgi:hypothetical protein
MTSCRGSANATRDPDEGGDLARGKRGLFITFAETNEELEAVTAARAMCR